MKKGNFSYFPILLIVLLIASNLLLLYKHWQQDEKTKQLIAINESNNILNESTTEALSDYIRLISANSGFKIPVGINLETESGEQIRLSKIKINKHKLVFRFTKLSCMDCVYMVMGEIDSLVRAIGYENVLVLTSYKDKRNLSLNKHVRDEKLPVYYVPHKTLNTSLEDHNLPYLFIMDKNGNTSNLFIPNKEIPELSKKYFEDIMKYF